MTAGLVHRQHPTPRHRRHSLSCGGPHGARVVLRPRAVSFSRQGSVTCWTTDCDKKGIVWLSGRPLCPEHYLQQVNELNELGLTPRGVTEAKENIDNTPALERRVREPLSDDWPTDVRTPRPGQF